MSITDRSPATPALTNEPHSHVRNPARANTRGLMNGCIHEVFSFAFSYNALRRRFLLYVYTSPSDAGLPTAERTCQDAVMLAKDVSGVRRDG